MDPSMQMEINAAIAKSKEHYTAPQSDERPATENKLVEQTSASGKEPVAACTGKKPLDVGHTFSGVMNNCTINTSYK